MEASLVDTPKVLKPRARPASEQATCMRSGGDVPMAASDAARARQASGARRPQVDTTTTTRPVDQGFRLGERRAWLLSSPYESARRGKADAFLVRTSIRAGPKKETRRSSVCVSEQLRQDEQRGLGDVRADRIVRAALRHRAGVGYGAWMRCQCCCCHSLSPRPRPRLSQSGFRCRCSCMAAVCSDPASAPARAASTHGRAAREKTED